MNTDRGPGAAEEVGAGQAAAVTIQPGAAATPSPAPPRSEPPAQRAEETGEAMLPNAIPQADDADRDKALLSAAKALGAAWQAGPASAASTSGRAVPPAADRPGLDLRALARGTFPPSNGGPIDRARRLVALGLGVEALAVLAQADPAKEAYPILKGAAACLAGRPEAALLFDAALDADPEIGFWRTMAALRLGRPFDPTALRAATGTLTAYPKELVRRFVPLILEAMLAKGSLADAARLAEFIPLKWPDIAKSPAILLLQGRVRLAAGDAEKARDALEAAARGTDFASAVAARKYLVDVDIAAGLRDPAAALAVLERQRSLWRGQGFEEDFMRSLAALAGRAGLLDSQLAALREIAGLAASEDGREAALSAARAILLAAVDRGDPGAGLRLVAYVRMQPQLAEGPGDGLRIKALAEGQAQTMGLSGLVDAVADTSNPEETPGDAGSRLGPPPPKPPVPGRAMTAGGAPLPPIGKVAGKPEAVATALDREVAAARAILAAARAMPSAPVAPLAP